MPRPAWFLVVAVFPCSAIAGCGGKEGNQVIQPAEDYQLTEQELKNRAGVQADAKSRPDDSSFSGAN
jgi:hypothetical protein